jgi:hypothetical protein
MLRDRAQGRLREGGTSSPGAARSRICAATGPRQSNDGTGITQYLAGVQKYVVSSTTTNPGTQNTAGVQCPYRVGWPRSRG